MRLSDFDYHLPRELIAQKPVKPRDYSRLMVLDKKTNVIKHDHFYNLLKYLNKNDVLVFNDTKVFPARLIGKRITGGRVEIFLLKKNESQGLSERMNHSVIPDQIGNPEVIKPVKQNWIPAFAGITSFGQPKGEYWEVLIGNKKKKPGQRIIFKKELFCEIIKKIDESIWLVRFNKTGETLQKLIDKLGQVPVPPYIKSPVANRESRSLKNDYQTIYARYRGSVAAPTAGFHFTKDLFKKIKKAGIQTEFITLHVGFGTFQPVKIKDIAKHQMHAEWASLDSPTAKKLNEAKQQKKRIIAIGTTTVRILETFANKNLHLQPQHQWIKTFIYPGYKFKFIDAMITNFHLPKSTLLMLVSAFIGRKKILKSYQEAIKKKYRFYSFGDAMLII